MRASGLDWTIVRPPKMTGGRFTGTARHGETVMPRGLFPTMSRADVADFLLQQAADPSSARKVLRLLH